MADKLIIKDHFTNTAVVWRDKIYKPKKQQGLFEYFDKQYRFDHVVAITPAAKREWRAIDIGCGAGQLLPILTKMGFETYGLDVSGQMVKLARQYCEHEGVDVDVKVGDCENLQYPDNFFDLYVAMGVIEYMDDDGLILTEIKRVLRPGGTVIMTLRNIRSVHVRWREFIRGSIEIMLRRLVGRITGRQARKFATLSREHYPERFRAKLELLGFECQEERYTHFHFLPYPLNRLFFWLEAIVGKSMEKIFDGMKLPRLSSTYIIKFTKPGKMN